MEIKDRVLNITTNVNPSNISYDYTFTNKISKSLTRKDFSVLFGTRVDDPYFESRICINNIYEEYQIENVEYGSMYAEDVSFEKIYNLLGYYEDSIVRIYLITCSDTSINRIINVYDKAAMTSKYFGYLASQNEMDPTSITYIQYVNNTVYIIPNNMSYGITYIPLTENPANVSYFNNNTFKVYNVSDSTINSGVSTGYTTPGGILYNNNIYVIPNNSSFTPFKIDLSNNTTSQVTFDTSLLNKEIVYISQIGEDNSFGLKGQICFVSIDGSLYAIDMGDLTVSEFTSEYVDYSYVPTNDGIYITNQEEIHFLDYKQMLIYSYITNTDSHVPINNIKYYTMAIYEQEAGAVKQYLMGYNINSCYSTKPYYTTNSAIYQIRCFDTDDVLIKTLLEFITVKSTAKTITPPTIDGYSINIGEDYILPDKDSFVNGLYSIDYIYSATPSQVTFTVNNVSTTDELLSSYSVTYNIGDTYDIQSDIIDGYINTASENNSGTVIESSDTIITFTYESLEISPMESINGAFVNTRCIDNLGNVLLNTYSASYKGEVETISAPVIPGYTNIYSSPSTLTCVADINTVVYIYKQSAPTTKVVYMNNGIIAYEEIVLNIDGNITLTPPSYLSVADNTLTTKQSYFTVQCTVVTPTTVLQIVGDNKNIINNIILEEKVDSLDRQILIPNGTPDITEHISYNNLDIYIIGFKTSNNNAYIYHTFGDEILSAEFSSLSKYETLEVTPIQPELYSMSTSSTKYSLTYNDNYIFISYIERVYETSFKTINLINNSIIRNDVFNNHYNESFNHSYVAINNYVVVASTTPVTTEPYQNCDKEFFFYVVPTDFKPTCSLNVNDNRIAITNTTPVKFGYPIFYNVVDSVKTNIYKPKEIYYIYNQDDGVDTNITSILSTYEYILVPYDKFILSSVPDNSIIIDGHYTNKKKYLNISSNNNVLYVPLDITYASIETTITNLLKCSCSYIDGDIKTSKINITPTIVDKKFSKNSDITSVHVAADHNLTQNKIYNISMIFPQYDITIDSVVDYTINTIGTFSKSIYVIDEEFNTEPSNYSSIGNNIISFKKQENDIVIDEMLHFYMIDEFGNITNTAHENIYIEIGNNIVPETLLTDEHIYKISKSNHRYRGVKESIKFYNFYKQYWDNLKYLDIEINNLINSINTECSDRLNSIRYNAEPYTYQSLTTKTHAYLQRSTHDELNGE